MSHAPRTRRVTIPLVGPLWPEAASDRRHASRRQGRASIEKAWTDRVRWSGRVRRKKPMCHEMTGDVPGISLSPTLPWAARLGLRAPRHTVLACRVPPLEPIACRLAPPDNPGGTSTRARPSDGPAAAASSLLASDPPRLPVEGVRDPEGFAFTAVSPFY